DQAGDQVEGGPHGRKKPGQDGRHAEGVRDMARRERVQSRVERRTQDELIAVSKARARPPDEMLEELGGGRNAHLREDPVRAYIGESIALTPPVAGQWPNPAIENVIGAS